MWDDVLPRLLATDLRLANLVCVISSRGKPWHPHTKPFHFRADPQAIDVLSAARIDCVTLTNNHILDYGPVTLMEQASMERMAFKVPQMDCAAEEQLVRIKLSNREDVKCLVFDFQAVPSPSFTPATVQVSNRQCRN